MQISFPCVVTLPGILNEYLTLKGETKFNFQDTSSVLKKHSSQPGTAERRLEAYITISYAVVTNFISLPAEHFVPLVHKIVKSQY